ncbi:SusD/RagB family nutrient-binding outer membrane lipoprotein [Chitinophaga rhizophila]|uniref:SusD/RagB family nutrient-binding outer membrane lipoprotein n=1 Tax=Chitinophaga rhizophila TaxID=2866212 RepID=A0ABS7G5V7_9BACT|nr:SusD/RagB family nutrient-binding outer membrane lipoprotein [Chitinophaga rhizophila]MBW8683004.1 SusD/RagB family nutrient-binding outer membrane lipoprotein [Chitinophaga rhizophila]
MKKILIIAGLSFSMMTSCSKFEEINVNPNNPATVPAEMLLPPLISSAAGSVSGSGNRAGQFVQHLAWLGGTSEEDGRYNLTGASFREEWNGPMRLIKDVNQLKQIAQQSSQTQYEAIGHIMKVYILSLMSDAFGDIPYNEAGMGNVQGYEFAHYQSQQEVYQLMLADLETANQLLKALPPAATINRDILFNGDATLWRKFANSLKIRILMRQSAKVNVAEQVAAIFNNPAEYPVFTKASEQAALVYNNSIDFYYWFIRNLPADGSGVDFGANSRVSDVMVDMLKAKNDPRLYIYAAPTRNSFLANRVNPATPLEYRGQRAGLSTAEQVAQDASTGLNKDDYSVIGRRFRAENRAFLMTYAELLLLKAEAIHRNMGVSGDAATVFQEAIRASFDKWPAGAGNIASAPFISAEQQTAYFNQPSTILHPSTAIQQIAEQLWIDSYLNGFEGWAGWRRLGYPVLKAGPSVLAPIPVRYVYSDNEQNNPNLVEWINQTMDGKMPTHDTKVWFQP